MVQQCKYPVELIMTRKKETKKRNKRCGRKLDHELIFISNQFSAILSIIKINIWFLKTRATKKFYSKGQNFPKSLFLFCTFIWLFLVDLRLNWLVFHVGHYQCTNPCHKIKRHFVFWYQKYRNASVDHIFLICQINDHKNKFHFEFFFLSAFFMRPFAL